MKIKIICKIIFSLTVIFSLNRAQAQQVDCYHECEALAYECAYLCVDVLGGEHENYGDCKTYVYGMAYDCEEICEETGEISVPGCLENLPQNIEEFQDQDADGSPAFLDCDDNDPNRFPDNPEICDEIDNDCDDEIDEEIEDLPTWYADLDRDGFGNDENTVSACQAPDGFIDQGGDCNDDDRFINPNAGEYYYGFRDRGLDYNCNGRSGVSDSVEFYSQDFLLEPRGWENKHEICDINGDQNPDFIISEVASERGYVSLFLSGFENLLVPEQNLGLSDLSYSTSNSTITFGLCNHHFGDQQVLCEDLNNDQMDDIIILCGNELSIIQGRENNDWQNIIDQSQAFEDRNRIQFSRFFDFFVQFLDRYSQIILTPENGINDPYIHQFRFGNSLLSYVGPFDFSENPYIAIRFGHFSSYAYLLQISEEVLNRGNSVFPENVPFYQITTMSLNPIDDIQVGDFNLDGLNDICFYTPVQIAKPLYDHSGLVECLYGDWNSFPQLEADGGNFFGVWDRVAIDGYRTRMTGAIPYKGMAISKPDYQRQVGSKLSFYHYPAFINFTADSMNFFRQHYNHFAFEADNRLVIEDIISNRADLPAGVPQFLFEFSKISLETLDFVGEYLLLGMPFLDRVDFDFLVPQFQGVEVISSLFDVLGLFPDGQPFPRDGIDFGVGGYDFKSYKNHVLTTGYQGLSARYFPIHPIDYQPYDSDGDRYYDFEDNCILNHNPDQSDADGDGIGDVCEENQ